MKDAALHTAEHLEELLDRALDETFPASDPVAIDVPRRTEPVLHDYDK